MKNLSPFKSVKSGHLKVKSSKDKSPTIGKKDEGNATKSDTFNAHDKITYCNPPLTNRRSKPADDTPGFVYQQEDMNTQLHCTTSAGELDRDMILSSQDSEIDMLYPDIVRTDSISTILSDLTSYTSWSKIKSSLLLRSITRRSSIYKNSSTQNNQLDRNGMKIVDIGHYHEWSRNDRHKKNSRLRFVSENDKRHPNINNKRHNFSLNILRSDCVQRKDYRTFSKDSVNRKSSSVEHSANTAPAMLGQSANMFQEILDGFVLDLKIANMR